MTFRKQPMQYGQPVEISAQDSNVLVKAIGEPKLTLAQKLAAFDPALQAARSWPLAQSEMRRSSGRPEIMVPRPARHDLD
jgi:hypothetical protein